MEDLRSEISRRRTLVRAASPMPAFATCSSKLACPIEPIGTSALFVYHLKADRLQAATSDIARKNLGLFHSIGHLQAVWIVGE